MPLTRLLFIADYFCSEKLGHYIGRPMAMGVAFSNSRTVDPHDIGRGDGPPLIAGNLRRHFGRSSRREVWCNRIKPATKEFLQRCRRIRSLFLRVGIRSDNGKLTSFSGGLVHNSRGQSKQVSMPREFQLTVAENRAYCVTQPNFSTEVRASRGPRFSGYAFFRPLSRRRGDVNIYLLVAAKKPAAKNK